MQRRHPPASAHVLSLLLLAALAACGGSDSTNPPADRPPPPANTSVTIVTGASGRGNQAFSPNPFTVTLPTSGTVTIQWFNNDFSDQGDYTQPSGVTHTVTSDNAAFNSGNVQPNTSFAFTFAAPGTYAYHCSIHPSMVGIVVVQ